MKFWSIFFGVMFALSLSVCVYSAVMPDAFAYYSAEDLEQIPIENSANNSNDEVFVQPPDDSNGENNAEGIVSASPADTTATADQEDKTDVSNDQTADSRLNDIYRKSLYSLSDATSNIISDLNKLSVSNSLSMAHKLLVELSGYSYSCAADLAILPDDTDGTSCASAIKFTNQLSDYCRCLANTIGDGKALTTADRNNLTALAANAESFNKEVLAAIEEERTSLFSWDESVSTDTESEFKYPALVYDGAYSDAVVKKDIAIGEEKSTEQIAGDLQSFLTDYGVTSVTFDGEVNSYVSAYSFTATSENATYTVLTLKDGRVLQLNGYGIQAGDKSALSKAEYCKMAEEYVTKLGYENLSAVWSSEPVNDTVYLCLVYINDEIKYYPDMIKVAIDTTTNTVTAFEAYAYLANHTERELPKKFDAYSKAIHRLSSLLTATEITRALIPTECGEEYFCYEITAKHNGEEYLVYLDAFTLAERNILVTRDSQYGNYVM